MVKVCLVICGLFICTSYVTCLLGMGWWNIFAGSKERFTFDDVLGKFEDFVYFLSSVLSLCAVSMHCVCLVSTVVRHTRICVVYAVLATFYSSFVFDAQFVFGMYVFTSLQCLAISFDVLFMAQVFC